MSLPAAADGVPDWFAPLAALPATATAADFGRRIARGHPDAGGAVEAGRRSAVLLLFGCHDEGAWVLLTRRAATLRSHAGQVALPGGRVDPGDADPTAAALRETREECDVDPAQVAVAGTLPELYLPPSDWLVTPVLARALEPVRPRVVDPAEVERVELVPVGELTDPAHRFTVAHPSGFTGPGFGVRGLFVWGFTAMLLDRVLALADWEQPWDDARVVGLPEGVGA